MYLQVTGALRGVSGVPEDLKGVSGGPIGFRSGIGDLTGISRIFSEVFKVSGRLRGGGGFHDATRALQMVSTAFQKV